MSADIKAQADRERTIQAVKDAIYEGYPPPSKSTRGGQKTAFQRAAEVLGISTDKLNARLYRMRRAGEEPNWQDIAQRAKRADPAQPWLERPKLPSGDVPISELIQGLTERSDRLLQAHSARSWLKIKMLQDGPFGIACLGDPHLDSPGCNWRLVRRDAEIIRRTEGLFAANCGDSIDNWWGRLIGLKGKSFITDEEAWRLVEWLIDEIGEEKWVVWLLGNHDTKNDTGHLWKRICKNLVHMDDWQGRFCIVPPNGREIRVWAAHSFSGHSMWNPLHGAQKNAKFSGTQAHLMIQGHHHEWALYNSEAPYSHRTYWLAKARGYKFSDDHGEMHGYFPQAEGATIVSIVNPDAPTEAGFVQCSPELESAADYLTFLRRKRAA